jgi:hypothetical protein
MEKPTDDAVIGELLTFLDEEVRTCLMRATAAPLPLSRKLAAEAEELAHLRMKVSNSGSQACTQSLHPRFVEAA